MEFQSNEVGAESVDVEGCVLPKQVFKDKTFFLLQDTADYVGKSLYNVQMYLVEVKILKWAISYQLFQFIKENTKNQLFFSVYNCFI